MKNHSKIALLLSAIFLVQQLPAQDSLYLNDGKCIAVKVLEIENTLLKYKKYTNIDGPTYSVEKAKIKRVKYLNGDEEMFTVAEPTPEKETVVSKSDSPTKLTRGNNVFIKIAADELSGLSSEVKNLMHEWNYWHVVLNLEEADFILQITTLKEGMTAWAFSSVSSKALILSKSGSVLWESEYYKAHTSMYNGYNSLHSSLKKLFNNGLMKQYK